MGKNKLKIKLPSSDFLNDAFTKVEELEKISIESRPIIGNFILKGQVSFIYAPVNSGKTLILMNLLKNTTEDAFYFNADDGIAGGLEKVKISEKIGFKMILCGTKDENEPRNLLNSIKYTLSTNKGYFQNKVLIFDTVKKFVNPLDKSRSAEFLRLMRAITLDGGSVVLLGHTNKGYTPDVELVFEGTGDWINDVDCAYTLYPNEADNTRKQLLFKNEKSRGNVPREFTYIQNNAEELSYEEKIDSIILANKEYVESQKKELLNRLKEILPCARPYISVILHILEHMIENF